MKIPTPIKVLVCIGIIFWGCFETLQAYNRQYALEGGKNFLKNHNATVKSIDCHIPKVFAIDQSPKICVFNATPKQIQVLIDNLNYRLINTSATEEELVQLNIEFNKQNEARKKIDTEVERKMNDSLKIGFIKEHSCVGSDVDLGKFSELKVYGKSENKGEKRKREFYIFYKPSSETGCFSFESIGG
jgi:hypothetical protein